MESLRGVEGCASVRRSWAKFVTSRGLGRTRAELDIGWRASCQPGNTAGPNLCDPDPQTPAPVLRQMVAIRSRSHGQPRPRQGLGVARTILPNGDPAYSSGRLWAHGTFVAKGCASAIETSARPIGCGAQMKFSNKLPQAWNGSGIGCRTVGPGPVCLPMQAIQP